MILKTIDATSEAPVSDALIHYTASTIDVEGGDNTDFNGLINCGNYPIGTKFTILAGKNGYDIRNDEISVGPSDQPIVIPLNPQVRIIHNS